MSAVAAAVGRASIAARTVATHSGDAHNAIAELPCNYEHKIVMSGTNNALADDSACISPFAPAIARPLSDRRYERRRHRRHRRHRRQRTADAMTALGAWQCSQMHAAASTDP